MPAGRPKLEFKREQFEELCAISCTKEEIASVLHMSLETLENKIREEYKDNFSGVYKKFQGTGRQSLRRLQYQAAQKGNVTMLIWLGKQWLNQKDKDETPDDDKPPMKIHVSGKPDEKDLDPEQNDNLEISDGKA